MLGAWLKSIGQRHLDLRLRAGRDFDTRIMEHPGRWMAAAELETLSAELRQVAARTLPAGALTYGGFMRMAAKYWKTGVGEMWRSVSKSAFVTALQRLVPEIRSEHLEPAPAGVRAQALGPDGELVDDFVFQESDRIINVGNAPSPAATASLNIGRIIVDMLSARWA